MSLRKRPADDDRFRPDDYAKRPYSASAAASPRGRRSPRPRLRLSFPSYLDSVADLHPKVRLLCEIVATTTPSSAVERALDGTGVSVSTDDVETVLKLSYSHPSSAIAFFRWAGSRHLAHCHSPYSWNLVVDLLGKNLLFDGMWDAVRSMRFEGILSLATYASIFSSFAAAGRPEDALSAFNSMHLNGVLRDSSALNSILSAVCREGRVATARQFFSRTRDTAAPNADTFAILLEGCENEGDYRTAREVFDDMIASIGWDPANVPAYDSFLTTLVRSGSYGVSEALKILDKMKQKRCFPGMKFFRNALDVFVEKKDYQGALLVWKELGQHGGCSADMDMYNSIISLLCYGNQTNLALEMFDEMVVYGAFPDSQTYNILLQFLLKLRKLKESMAIFNEMVKNECYPTSSNLEALFKILLDVKDMEMALKVWKCMIENSFSPLEECGNLLVGMLRDVDMVPEACKCAEDMIDRGIKLNSSTLSKLRQSLIRVGKGDIHAHLLKKWKSR